MLKTRLNSKRKELNISVDDLAETVGCSARVINALESGEQKNSKYLADIARVLGTTAKWLLQGVDDGEVLGDRLNRLRREQSLTQSQLADKASVSQQSINSIESGRSQTSRLLPQIAEALNVSLDYLVHGEDVIGLGARESQAMYGLGEFDTWDSDTPLEDHDVELPYYREVELAAGHGSEIQLENGGLKLRFAKSTLKKAGVDASSAACVQVNGDSMEPVLPHGATVGIDTSSTKIKDGKMYAVDHAGMLRIKMLYRVPGGGVRLKSYNTEEFPDETYPPNEAADIRIIGQVFWWSVLV